MSNETKTLSLSKLCAKCGGFVLRNTPQRNVTSDGSVVVHSSCALPTNTPPDDGGTPAAIAVETKKAA
jgi:hypothetical protein